MVIPFKPSKSTSFEPEFEFNGEYFQVWYNYEPYVNDFHNEDVEVEILGLKKHIGESDDVDNWAIMIACEDEYFQKFTKAFGDFVFDSLDYDAWQDVEKTPEPTTHSEF